MADVNISKYRASVVRDGSKPSSPGFVVSEGQDPVNPPGTNNFVPYTGATANVELGEFGIEAGFVTLDTTPTNIPTDQGTIYWDDTRSTAALIMNGTLQHIGQDSFFYVKNSSGSTIPKGTCVGFAGTDGGSGHLLVTPFLANGSVPSTYFMGVTSEEIANGSFGQVMHFGELTGINTSGFTAGALLYASSTVAGAFQTTPPVAPNNIILVAAAVNSKNNGAIVVRPTLGSNINTDEGVKITSPTTGDLLQLQAGGLWENKTKAQILGGTSSQFVKGDGSLDSTSYQPLLTNPVTGTGTTNRLAKFTGASTIGNSNISDGGVTIFNENPTAGQFAWQFNGNTTTGQSFGASVVAGTNSSDIAFRVLNASASTTHLLVKGDGNLIVGGTADNGSRLQVSGTATISSTLTAGADVNLQSNESYVNLFSSYVVGLNSRARFRAVGAGGGSGYGGDFRLDTRATNNAWNTDVFVVNSSGNVGIGTTSPAVKLNIVDTNPLVVGDSTGSLAVTYETGTTAIGQGGGIFLGIPASSGSFFSTYIKSARESADGANSAAALVFGTRVNGGSNTERMRITSTGNVGIGTASPTWLLEVNKDTTSGSTGLYPAISVNNPNASGYGAYWFYQGTTFKAGIEYFNSTNTLSFYANSSTRMQITAGGNLLVGTTTDNGARLQVSGTATVSSSLTAGSLISASATFSNFGSATAAVVAFADGNTGFFRPALNTLGITTAGAERMRITSSGNVLIGTTTDNGAKLNVVGNLNAGGTGVNTDFRLYRTVAPSVFFSINAPGGSPNTSILGVNGTDVLALTATGNVGIGTTDIGSDFKMAINGGNGSTTGPLLVFQNSGTGTGNNNGFIVGNYPFDAYLWNYENANIILGTNNTERMRITSSGFTKSSNFGTYFNLSGAYHELVSNATADAVQIIQHRGTNPYGVYMNFISTPNNTSNYFLAAGDSTNTKFFIYSNGNMVNINGSYGTISDIKLKENISDALPKLDDILKLQVRNFNFIGDNKKQIGFIAQEFEKVFPSMVDIGIDKEKGNEYKSIKTSVLIPMLVKAIQELKQEIDTLKN